MARYYVGGDGKIITVLDESTSVGGGVQVTESVAQILPNGGTTISGDGSVTFATTSPAAMTAFKWYSDGRVGIKTNPVGTVGTSETSIWDKAVGTNSGAILEYLNGESDSGYWGNGVQALVASRIQETQVYKKVANMSGAQTHGYIKNIDTGAIWQFQFNPENLEYSRGATYVANKGPGQAYPIVQFVSGNLREFTVELYLCDRHIEPSGYIKNAINFIGAFLPPEQNVEEWKRPPQMLFFYGYFVRKCVLSDLNINITEMDRDGTPTEAKFTLTLQQIGVVT